MCLLTVKGNEYLCLCVVMYVFVFWLVPNAHVLVCTCGWEAVASFKSGRWPNVHHADWHPTSTGHMELETPLKMGQLIGEMSPYRSKWFPISHLNIFSPFWARIVVQLKSEESCIRNKPYLGWKQTVCARTLQMTAIILHQNKILPGFALLPPIYCFRSVSFEVGEDCRWLVPPSSMEP